MKSIAAIAVTLFTVVAGPAQGSDVDWKFYGGLKDEYCFYEANDLVRGLGDHIRVWIKCLAQKDMEAIDIEKDFDGKIVNKAAEKVAMNYVPPIAMVEDVNYDRIVEIV